MRPFATEVAGIAGWHDGRAINVLDYASEDDDVRYHEAQHGRIFLSTPDGQMLHACIQYADKPALALERDHLLHQSTHRRCTCCARNLSYLHRC